MSLSFADLLEKQIRQSFVGTFLSQFRERSPHLYRFARSLYWKAFPMKSEHQLGRYQARAMRRMLDVVPKEFLEQGILELGSDLDAKMLRELSSMGFAFVAGVNPAFESDTLEAIQPTLPKGCSLSQTDARSLDFPDESFGVVMSVAVFEHLLDFDLCLQEMFRVLVPGGYVFAEFGPIWSSSLGHHVKAEAGGVQARHFDPLLNPVENHSHLLLSPEEMKASLEKRVSSALSDAIVHWIYETDELNRMFYEEYVQAFEESPFEVVFLEQDREHVPEEMLTQLRQKHSSFHIFDVRNAGVLLRKPLSC